jgi:CheY-like chemotaxis protein
LSMLVRMWGYECRAAYDGAAGLKAACDFRPDCLLLDIAMPGLDGYMLAREVRAQPGLDRAKLIALTAYSDETHVRLSQVAGFDYNFVKPPDLPAIRRLIDTLDEMVRLTGDSAASTN